MTTTTGPRRPPGRYDEPRALPRPVLIAVGATLLLAVAAGAWWASERSRQGAVDSETSGYHVVSDASVVVTFQVHKPANRVAACQVEALDRDGSVVGSALVRVGAASSEVTTSQELTTQRRAATAVVTGCRLEPTAGPASP